MNLCVYAVKPADGKWKQMKDIWDSCNNAGIQPPDEVKKFFDWEYPTSDGKLIDITQTPGVVEYSEEMVDGYDIDITQLPEDTTKLRVTYVY